MKIFTPQSALYSLIDLSDFIGIQILPHDGPDSWKLVAYSSEGEESPYVCIKIGTREEVESVALAITNTGADTRFAPTTPTFH